MRNHHITVLLSLLFLSLSLALLACGEPPTMAERFRAFGNAYCSRQVACDVIPSEGRRTCVDEEVESSCFEGRDCNSRDYYLHEDMWEGCLSSLDDYDCEKIAQGLAPEFCANAWRPPGERL